MKRLILKTILGLVSITTFSQTTVATYDIVFTSNWEAHGTIPANAHFTELVGATHNSNVTFFEIGEQVSSGVELVAELGSSGTFRNTDVTNAINTNNADQYIDGPNLFFNDVGRTISINDLSVNSKYPLISLISMIAPSPDWIIAVNSLSLIDGDGQWIPQITLDLYPYDAGTEEGTGYSLNNSSTIPQEAMTSIQNVAPFNNEKIGTIVFTQKVLNVQSFEDTDNKIKVSPNPTNGHISITNARNSSISEIEVYNVLGKRIRGYSFKKNNAIINLDLTCLNTGIYLLRIHNSKGKTETKKISIN